MINISLKNYVGMMFLISVCSYLHVVFITFFVSVGSQFFRPRARVNLAAVLNASIQVAPGKVTEKSQLAEFFSMLNFTRLFFTYISHPAVDESNELDPSVEAQLT